MASIEGPRGSKETDYFSQSSPAPDPSLKEIVENFPDKMSHAPIRFSGVVAVQVDDGTIVEKSHPSGASFEADRAFNILSVGKLFTAVAAMQLVEGMGTKPLSLDTPLNELLTIEDEYWPRPSLCRSHA